MSIAQLFIDGLLTGRMPSRDTHFTELPIQDMEAVLTHIADLERQLDEQKRMIAIIHESHILQSIPLKRRIDMVMRYLNTYSAKQLCRVFEIKPSPLYYHIDVKVNNGVFPSRARSFSRKPNSSWHRAAVIH